MNDSTKNIVYGVLIGLPTMLVIWVFSLYFFGCGSTNSCTGIPQPNLTPVPTLLAATMPAPKVGAEAVAATPKCSIAALNLIGAWVSAGYSEKDTFTFTDAKGANCTANFKDDVQKLFVTPNLWYDGAPACTTCHYADVAKAVKNMDLSSYAGILAGSGRANGEPKGNDILGGGKWADALLHKMLFAPGGKTEIGRPPMPLGRPATVPAEGPVISAGIPAGSEAASTGPTPAPIAEGAATPTAEVVEIARPSNPGGPGDAVKTKGDAKVGEQIFTARCVPCHGDQGKAGIPNPGSDDGSVPPLNPIDSTLVSADALTYATNLDLFIEHGSKPAGDSPVIMMPAWGDQKLLSPQEITDVIAYIISLNK
jgi:mono/diheme cytochrome c family protein